MKKQPSYTPTPKPPYEHGMQGLKPCEKDPQRRKFRIFVFLPAPSFPNTTYEDPCTRVCRCVCDVCVFVHMCVHVHVCVLECVCMFLTEEITLKSAFL